VKEPVAIRMGRWRVWLPDADGAAEGAARAAEVVRAEAGARATFRELMRAGGPYAAGREALADRGCRA